MRALPVLAGVLLLAGCGDGASVSGGEEDRPRLVVSAVATLKQPLTACAPDFPDAELKLRFADKLVGNIDVFVAQNKQAQAQAGKLRQPVVFATRGAATYAAGVVVQSGQPDVAEAFVDDLRAGGCHDALLAAGYGEPR